MSPHARRVPPGARRPLLLAVLLLAGGARASDADDLAAALRHARTLAARGEAVVTVLFPPRSEPNRTAKALPAVPFRPSLIARNFTVVRGGTETVAGRPAARFELTPKVGEAARWTLWIDAAWNIPLAFEERKSDGTLARRAAFVKVNDKPAKVQVKVPAIPEGLRAAVLAAFPGLRLPPGFTPAEVRVRENGRVDVSLTDGVNVLALVAAPRRVADAQGVASRQAGNGFVWLVGNLPDLVLGRALDGLRGADVTALGTFLPSAASGSQENR